MSGRTYCEGRHFGEEGLELVLGGDRQRTWEETGEKAVERTRVERAVR